MNSEKILAVLNRLNQNRSEILFEVQNLECRKADGYKTDNTIPADGWQSYNPNIQVYGKDEHFWFKAKVKTPKTKSGKQLTLLVDYGIPMTIDTCYIPQGLIYLNGEMTQGIDGMHREVYLEYDTEYEIVNYHYVGRDANQKSIMRFFVKETDLQIEKVYYDFSFAYQAYDILDDGSDDALTIFKFLDSAANMLDFREVFSKEYYDAIANADKFFEEEFYGKLCTTENKPTVGFVGHTHIDVEWLWTRAQTKEKIQRSFCNANELMKHYPFYKFMLSQPNLYKYLKDEAPEKYEELKELIKSGRWEAEGAMWVEADCNLSSGESLIRQIYQGKKFFKDEFGVDNKVLLLPDVFGYSAALPQILKKCGIEHFVTSKISWNDSNTMPFDTFMWQGIDGSEIFTNFITAQSYKRQSKTVKNENLYRHTSYVAYVDADMAKGAWHRNQQRSSYTNRALVTYGFGDGGGGPTKDMLEGLKRLSKGFPGIPVAKATFLYKHLEKARKEFEEGCKITRRTPLWVGELYLEFHRGTYTSISKNKKNNRRAEFLMQKCEALSVADMLLGGEYNAKTLYENWNTVLHNQFHDIIPGSSIKEVYDGTDIDYAEINKTVGGIFNEKLEKLASNNEKSGILVYNPLGFERTGTVNIDGKTVELSKKIPSMGWSVIDVPEIKNTVKVNSLTAENKFYIMTLDNAGRIISLYDKRADREVFKNKQLGNELKVFENIPPAYPEWEIKDYYKDKSWSLDEKADIKPITDGTRAGFCVTKKHKNSVITQKIWLYSENENIDFETDTNWVEKNQLLKVVFPVDVLADKATYEIQFGHVERPTHSNTSWEAAKFEVCAQKWVDISEYGYGVSLINDCKYGHSANGSTLSLTLIKTTDEPERDANDCKQSFTYSLLPHTGDFRSAGTVKKAYSLNQPLCTKKALGKGNIPAEFSAVCAENDNIIIETLKKAENDNSVIIRLYDSFKQKGKVNITLPKNCKKAYLCDMLENELNELKIINGKTQIPVLEFEIVTLKVTF